MKTGNCSLKSLGLFFVLLLSLFPFIKFKVLVWNELSSGLNLIIKPFQHEKAANIKVQYRNKALALFYILCENYFLKADESTSKF